MCPHHHFFPAAPPLAGCLACMTPLSCVDCLVDLGLACQGEEQEGEQNCWHLTTSAVSSSDCMRVIRQREKPDVGEPRPHPPLLTGERQRKGGHGRMDPSDTW